MGDDLVVPCQIKFKDGWLRTINLIVAFRESQDPTFLRDRRGPRIRSGARHTRGRAGDAANDAEDLLT